MKARAAGTSSLGAMPVIQSQPPRGTLSKLISGTGLMLPHGIINLLSSKSPFVR